MKVKLITLEYNGKNKIYKSSGLSALYLCELMLTTIKNTIVKLGLFILTMSFLIVTLF